MSHINLIILETSVIAFRDSEGLFINEGGEEISYYKNKFVEANKEDKFNMNDFFTLIAILKICS